MVVDKRVPLGHSYRAIPGRRQVAKLKYEQIQDGEWFSPRKKSHQEQCCDCGLVHTIDYRIVGGAVQLRATRNERRTAAVRRGKAFQNLKLKTQEK